MDYSITVETTDLRGNGTDGRVLLMLHGARGNSAEMELSDGGSDRLFERGSSTDFVLSAPDLGELRAVTVRLVRKYPPTFLLVAGEFVSDAPIHLESSG